MLGRSSIFTAIVGVSLMSPADAADKMAILDYGSGRTVTAGYAGATLSLLRTGKGRAQPVLRFGAGMRQALGSAPSLAIAPSALEFRWTGSEDKGFYLGGRRFSATEGKSGLDTGEVFLIVAGVAAAALLVTQVAGSDDDDDDERCLLPEGCN